MRRLILLLSLVLLLSACGESPPTPTPAPTPTPTPPPINDSPPAYVKTVSALKAGSDGLTIYFILADAGGADTSADGTVTLTIRDTAGHTCVNVTVPAKKTDFQKATVGLGGFAHDAILYNIGRIPYSDFIYTPSTDTGKVIITFTPTGGAALTGDTSVFFN